jgi:hypothetical protein
MSALLSEIVTLHRAQLRGLIEVRGVARMKKIYAEARAELEGRLAALKKAGRGQTFGAQQLSQVLVQVADVARGFEGDLENHLKDVGGRAGALAPRQLVSTIARMEAAYGRTTPVVQAAQAAVALGAYPKVAPSLLSRYRSSARLYGPQAVGAIQRRLALSIVQGEGIDDAVDRVAGVNGLFAGQRWRAERIVRTEMHYTVGVTTQVGLMDLRGKVPKLMKRWVETFDDRTGEDSKELNGQTVPVDQPFVWVVKDSRGRPTGKTVRMLQGPNRPNDRSVCVPFLPHWGGEGLGPVGDQA